LPTIYTFGAYGTGRVRRINMTIQEAIELILKSKDAPEVQELAKQFNPLANVTKDNAGELVEKHDALKSYRDAFFARSLESWKEKNLPKLVEEEINKRNPPETPEAKKLAELMQKVQELETGKTRESLRAKAIQEASKKGLPTDFVDYLVGQDETSTMNNLNSFSEAWTKAIQSQVEEKLKKTGIQPQPSDVVPKDGPLTREQVAKMTPEQINEIFEKNPERLKNLK
jgi:hypothetical protein